MPRGGGSAVIIVICLLRNRRNRRRRQCGYSDGNTDAQKPKTCQRRRGLRVVEKGTVDDDDKGGVISPRLLGCRLVIRNRLVLPTCIRCSRTLLGTYPGSRCVYAYRLKRMRTCRSTERVTTTHYYLPLKSDRKLSALPFGRVYIYTLYYCY